MTVWSIVSYGFLRIRERSNFPWVWFWDVRVRFWGLEIKHLTAHNFVWQGCFFFHYYLATWTTNWAQTFTGLLLLCTSRYTKWEDWSLIITNSVHCFKTIIKTPLCQVLQIFWSVRFLIVLGQVSTWRQTTLKGLETSSPVHTSCECIRIQFLQRMRAHFNRSGHTWVLCKRGKGIFTKSPHFVIQIFCKQIICCEFVTPTFLNAFAFAGNMDQVLGFFV